MIHVRFPNKINSPRMPKESKKNAKMPPNVRDKISNFERPDLVAVDGATLGGVGRAVTSPWSGGKGVLEFAPPPPPEINFQEHLESYSKSDVNAM